MPKYKLNEQVKYNGKVGTIVKINPISNNYLYTVEFNGCGFDTFKEESLESIRKIYDVDGNVAKCSYCHKELDTSMELEYSDDINTLCCSPDCAATIYFDSLRSRSVDEDDLKELGYKINR